ncbi:MAG: hypothetical protein PVG81_00295 [Desulfobacterales bacterium]
MNTIKIKTLMLLRSYFFLPLFALILTGVGCAGPKATKAPSAISIVDPIRVQSADLAVALIRIAEKGNKETLVEDPGWLEYVIEIENLSANALTVQNVKLLNQDGRYVDSASAYEQITAPPDVGAELAGDVAQSAAGIAAGQMIPYGGSIFGVLSSAASAWSAGTKKQATRVFRSRMLKNVELAPAGELEGSAFLPNMTRPKALVVDYTQDVTTNRIEIPLPIEGP